MEKYYIYDVSPIGDLNLISHKKKVSEDDFNEKLTLKLKEVAQGDESKMEKIRIEIDKILAKGSTVTISKLCFEIKN